ncbi:MAG: type II toxin-antitoxin system RelE/ParE family toxin [Sulfurimonas sp.]|uniref:type II toxin-antitoxin system RelE family toxin n=1 Tax=Sulfurimonas sp. TaxID=2022749 RepID=UPI00260ACBCA|nr:type II toxin-antitoxin system RelE/ParE family toxin [Sulfurimonas sp.]MDD5400715.1 type II toxin-antitoxin system RelE/ParE family toxin [Sulfurimonas sp.]
MTYKVGLIEESKKDIKNLAKKYPLIKKDILTLIDDLEVEPTSIGVHLGKNVYKVRLKNSSVKKGKSGGFRVIYYVVTEEFEVLILKIYSKSYIENIYDEEILNILEKALKE